MSIRSIPDAQFRPWNWPATNAVAVTPSDTVDLTYPSRGIIVGVAGNIAVNMMESGTNVVIPVAAGVVHPLRVTRVYSTSTTATTIVALY